MAADGSLLQGEVIDDPEKEDRDVEKLLSGFFRALLDEQRLKDGTDSAQWISEK